MKTTKTNKQQELRNLMAKGVKNRNQLKKKSKMPAFDVNRAIRHYIREGQTRLEKVQRSLECGNTEKQTRKMLNLIKVNKEIKAAFGLSRVLYKVA